MNGYKILRKGVTMTVQYGTAITAGITAALLRNVNDTRIVKSWKKNDQPHKRPMQDAAMELTFCAAGLIVGEKLAEKVGKDMDALHDEIVKVFKPKKQEEKTKQENPVDVEFTVL